ncbi:MAG: hypothetical protein MZV70_14000 [Desulfobacterales bacterium]|nr:hypothetical protein [Desulfobacterales bacterium]
MLRQLRSACCENDTFTDTALSAYERRWQADMGRELELGYRMFQLRQKISAIEMDALIRALNDPGIVRTIVEYGDMDRSGDAGKKLLLKPAILKWRSPASAVRASIVISMIPRPRRAYPFQDIPQP